MRVRVITPPPPIVSWAEADAHLKLDGDESQKPLVEALIAAASGHLDGPTGWLGRAIGVQTLELRLYDFDTGDEDAIGLLYRPIISIESVKYLDTDGIEQTMLAGDYELRGHALGLAYGKSWPALRSHAEAVRVRYKAGYVANPTADPLVAAVPEAIKRAILLMVGDLHRYRETAVAGTIAGAIPMSTTVENLLAPYRVFA